MFDIVTCVFEVTEKDREGRTAAEFARLKFKRDTFLREEKRLMDELKSLGGEVPTTIDYGEYNKFKIN